MTGFLHPQSSLSRGTRPPSARASPRGAYCPRCWLCAQAMTSWLGPVLSGARQDPQQFTPQHAGMLEAPVRRWSHSPWRLTCCPLSPYRAQQLAPGDPQIILYVSLQLALVRQVSPNSS